MATAQTGLAQADTTHKVVDQLVHKVNVLDGTVNAPDGGLVRENAKLKDDTNQMMKILKAYDIRFVEMETEVQGIKNQMDELICVYDDLQDRLYEIDRSWQNNLVFHGIKPDPGGVHESMDCLESKIKSVLRTNLNIGRDIPIVRLQRIFNGSDVRGYKPVIVNFQKWSDKEDVLRKSKILKNTGVYVEEDFSRAAKFRRKELEKLAKEIKSLSPDKKCIFKHDKLIIDDHVYIYNDQDRRVERLPYSVSTFSGLDDEVGDSVSLTRRLRQRNILPYSSSTGTGSGNSFNANSKRAQSVESMLDRIPAVNLTGQDQQQQQHNSGNGHHSILSSSVSSNNINGGYHHYSPERRSKLRTGRSDATENEADDMEIVTDDNRSN